MSWLQQLTWWSALDIALISFLVYQFLLLVKGTRAAQMLAGAGVFLLALLFARQAPLPVAHWIADNIVPYALILFAVLFQAEIRHVLAKIGRAVTLSKSASEAESYDDIVMAANFFSQNQTGALIVVEREIGLRTYIESGVPMDARVSYDLLVTIFRPQAPLHDGAVIIQRDRIAAAACFLPLSMNPVLSNQLGTRHRAAIGITEETDAIAIAVSEETGQIALAQAGHIERGITVDELREQLGRLLHTFVPATTLPTPMDDVGESALRKTEIER
ncbi:MAG: diadenylate cyclase CdaA [Terriglobales bacterium]